MKRKRKKPSRVLSDHTKVGQRFIPPFTHALGPLRESSWVEVTLPELIWIACLSSRAGPKRGTELAVALSTAAFEQAPDAGTWFANASSYSSLGSEQQEAIVKELAQKSELDGLRHGLAHLQALYPKAPFAFLYEGDGPQAVEREAALEGFKSLLTGLFDKTTSEAVFAQGTAIYLGFVSGKLKVAPDVSLANFQLLENYPHTEESRKIAAAVRALAQTIVTPMEGPHRSDWAEYFWNRGLELEPCSIHA